MEKEIDVENQNILDYFAASAISGLIQTSVSDTSIGYRAYVIAKSMMESRERNLIYIKNENNGK